jgi:hypothetical protein
LPALDNGQFAWSLVLVAHALAPVDPALAARYEAYWRQLAANGVDVFLDRQAHRIRAEALIVDTMRTEVTPANYAAESSYFLDDPYEGEAAVLFLLLLGDWSGLEGEAQAIWHESGLAAAEYVTQQGTRLTTRQGCWYSAHETWGNFLVLPYLDDPLFARLARLGERARTIYSAGNGIAGLLASTSRPVDHNRRQDEPDTFYVSAVGIPRLADLRVDHTDIVCPYASFPVLAVSDTGLAWLLTTLRGPKGVGPLGAAESQSVGGQRIASVKTMDGTVPPLLMLCRPRPTDLMRSALQALGVYDAFRALVAARYGAVFAGSSLLGVEVPFALPSAALPAGPEFGSGRTNLVVTGSYCRPDSDASVWSWTTDGTDGQLCVESLPTFLWAYVPDTDVALNPRLQITTAAAGPATVWLELKNAADRPIVAVTPGSATYDRAHRIHLALPSDPTAARTQTLDLRRFLIPGEDTHARVLGLSSFGGPPVVFSQIALLPDAANRAPVANAGADVAAATGTPVQLTGAAVDVDGDSMRYRWAAPPGIALSDSTAAQPTFCSAVAGVFPFRLTVSDGWAVSAADTVSVAVGPPQVVWAIGLSLTQGLGASQMLPFGVAEGATDGLDAALGEAEAPPVPPVATFDARWLAPAPLEGLTLDYRGTAALAAGATWTLAVLAGGADGAMVLTWAPACLPAVGSFRLVDAATGGVAVDLDMRAVDHYEWTADGARQLQVRFEPAERASHTYVLQRGWALVSLPVAVPDPSAAAVFPGAASLFSYGAGYEPAPALLPAKGYWLNVPSPQRQQVNGWAPADTALVRRLPARWSLVGTGNRAVPVAGLKAMCPQLISVYGYAGHYLQVSTLDPGLAYWINLSAPAELDLSGRTAPAGRPLAEAPAERAAPTLWAEGAAGCQVIALGVSDAELVELPPAPPAGLFDARVELPLGVGTVAVPTGDGSWPLRLQGGVERLRWRVTDSSSWRLEMDGAVIPLSGTGQVAVAAGTQVRIHHGPPRPVVTALRRGHPNPFNPSTTIRYELAAAEMVRLQILSASGQRVRELVAQRQESGVHRVSWDGRDGSGNDVANGVYVAVLQAGPCRASQRLVLTKWQGIRRPRRPGLSATQAGTGGHGVGWCQGRRFRASQGRRPG